MPGSIVDGMTGRDHYFPNDTAQDLNTGPFGPWDLSYFDAIVIHFVLRTTIEGYIPSFLIDQVAKFSGPKILFIQDEYDNVKITWSHMKAMGITDVFTCVPEIGREHVYPAKEFPNVSFVQTLTGYVPDDTAFQRHAQPLNNRRLHIGYRGRQLPHHRGLLGYEKRIIGDVVKVEAQKRGLSVDIETDDSRRIYDGWHKFLGQCRATLGTESGCNIFDFDGDLRTKALELADQPFEVVYNEYFKAHEAPFEMNQISPKFFEAILLHTALICFPGTYSGILKENIHYIPLEKDFSNIEEVFKKVNDDAFLKQLTDRAYRDIVESGKYSYSQFVSNFDGWLDSRIPPTNKEIIVAPIAVRRGDRVKPIQYADPRDYIINSVPLGGRLQRQNFRKIFAECLEPKALDTCLREIDSLNQNIFALKESNKSLKESWLSIRTSWLAMQERDRAKKKQNEALKDQNIALREKITILRERVIARNDQNKSLKEKYRMLHDRFVEKNSKNKVLMKKMKVLIRRESVGQTPAIDVNSRLDDYSKRSFLLLVLKANLAIKKCFRSLFANFRRKR